MYSLSIIIVSFNTKDLLRACLNSLPYDKDNTQIIVVDNNSSDDSVQMVISEFPHVQVIPLSTNAGFAKANNLGIKEASGRNILFLNPDTVIPSETIPPMINFLQSDPSFGVATCLVRLAKNSQIDLDCHRGFPTPWASFCYFTGLEKLFPKSRIFGQYHQTWKDLSTIHEIDSAVGAFMLVRREIGEKVGWWDEDFFFYGEDLDFCYKAKELGYKVMYNPTIEILHYKGVSSGMQESSKEVTTATKGSRQKALNASVNAMEIFYNKHYKGKYPALVDALVTLGMKLMRFKRIVSGKR